MIYQEYTKTRKIPVQIQRKCMVAVQFEWWLRYSEMDCLRKHKDIRGRRLSATWGEWLIKRLWTMDNERQAGARPIKGHLSGRLYFVGPCMDPSHIEYHPISRHRSHPITAIPSQAFHRRHHIPHTTRSITKHTHYNTVQS